MDPSISTPRPRPHLKFANHIYQFSASAQSPAARRLGTPQTAPSRKILNRDDLPPSSLSKSSLSAARNIFRASSITNATPQKTSSPQLPASATKKLFAPGATPTTKRLFRDSVAQPTPRGMASKTTANDLFNMRIPSPDPELTGAAISKDIPAELKDKATVYADQYLKHLVPPEFDEDQRRQFFCILDLRRLKFAADEIFAKKDWRLNIKNFASEFEKSRSLILLRYGLYEFKNVKPSAEVLKKWRAEHGLPDPEEDAATASPPKANGFKPTSMKRKAEEELPPKETPLSSSTANLNKRRAPEKEEQTRTNIGASAKKRKASVSDEQDENQSAKQPKSTPSATKSLFERIANKSTSTPTAPKPAANSTQFGSTLTPTIFAPTPRTASGASTGSVLDGIKPGTPQPTYGQENLFGHLSDASAQNSGGDADAESEPDSPEGDNHEANQSYEPSVVASGGADTPSSLPGTNPFAVKKPFGSGLAPLSSDNSSEGRETTPNRSLFDRVTKGSDGQPVRFGEEPKPAAAPSSETAPVEPAALETQTPKPAPTNNTWNPNTPIKFSTATPSSGALFGGANLGPSTSIFGKAPAVSSSIFGAKPASTPAVSAEPEKASTAPNKSGGESDKENTAKPATGSIFGAAPKTTEPAAQPSNIFAQQPAGAAVTKPLFGAVSQPPTENQPKPAATEKKEEPKKDQTMGPTATPAPTPGSSGLFGSSAKPEEAKPSALPTSAPLLFGQGSTSNTSAAPSPFQSSTLFGAATKLTTTPNAGATEQPKSLFGAAKANGQAPEVAKPAASLFNFGATASTNGAQSSAPLFGAPKTAETPAEPAKAPTAAPVFSFGSAPAAATPEPTKALFGGLQSAAPAAAKPLFGAVQPASTTEAAKPLFGAQPSTKLEPPKPLFGGTPSTPASSAKRQFEGSPMKEDEPSPAKKLFGGQGAQSASAAPVFSFGGATTAAPSNIFGNSTATPAAPAFGNGPVSFGSGTMGGGSFTFSAGGGNSAPFNPFATSSNAPAAAAPAPSAPSAGLFNFGGKSSEPAPAPAPAPAATGSSPFMFGAGGSASNAGASAPTTPAAGNTPNPFAGRVIKAARGVRSKSPFKTGGPASSQAGNTMAPTGSTPLFGGTAAPTPGFSFTSASPTPQPQLNGSSVFAPRPNPPAHNIFAANLQPGGGASTTGTNSPFNFGGASSLATTPAAGTPEPTADADTPTAADGDAEPPQEQISLTSGGPGEEDEDVVHEVRAKVLKFIPPGQGSDDDDKGGKTKSPWTTKGVGPFRLLKHKTTGGVRMLLRAEPRGHVALNRSLLPDMNYKAEEKYVKLTTSNEKGTGLETWMVQVKTKDLATALAQALESNKAANKA